MRMFAAAAAATARSDPDTARRCTEQAQTLQNTAMSQLLRIRDITWRKRVAQTLAKLPPP